MTVRQGAQVAPFFMARLGGVALGLMALAPAAQAFELAFPVACALGETCYIQQYPDHDPTPAATDFTCGPLSYDGHDGTDIALPDRAAMARGVEVLAAAEGVVRGVRDGVADGAPWVEGKECGNGVLLEHADGWQTQYCHMRQGSVAVKQGDRVAAGAVLGLVGQSGMAEFPHLHLSVRRNGQSIDPFAPDKPEACGGEGGAALWAQPLPYQAGGLIGAGIADAVPEYEAIKAGLPTLPLPDTAPALVLWGFVFGAQNGDALEFRLTGPEGEVLAETVPVTRTQAQMFRALGKKVGARGWPEGRYDGTVILMRNGVEVDRIAAAVAVGN